MHGKALQIYVFWEQREAKAGFLRDVELTVVYFFSSVPQFEPRR